MASPPTVKIVTPAEGDKFYVGEILRLKGEAFYANGTAIDDSTLQWEVRKHHSDHFHPFLDPTFGNDFDLFATPKPEDYNASLNTYLEISLSVIDENALLAQTGRIVQPKLLKLNLTSNIPGSTIRVEDEAIMMPEEIWGWENQQMRLRAENLPPFVFRSWSDGLRDPERLTTLGFSKDIPLEARFCVDDGGKCQKGFRTCCLGECNRKGICSVTVKLPPLYMDTRTLPPTPTLPPTTANPTKSPTSIHFNNNIQLPSLKISPGGKAMLSITCLLIVGIICSFLYLWKLNQLEQTSNVQSSLGDENGSQAENAASKEYGQEAFVNSVTSSSSGEGIATV